MANEVPSVPIRANQLEIDFPTMKSGSGFEIRSGVTATKEQCKQLEKQLNEKSDIIYAQVEKYKAYLVEIGDMEEKFYSNQQYGRTAITELENIIKSMRAGLDACAKVQKCDSAEFQTNMNSYREKAGVALIAINAAVSYVDKSLARLDAIQKGMFQARDTAQIATRDYDKIHLEFVKCEEGTGSIQVSITAPSKEPQSESSGTSSDAGSEATQSNVTSGASSASGASGQNGLG